jgi:hydrogenase nickel incorporation protein HypA/HybF
MRKIENVAEEQGARRVTGIKVRLGALSHFSEEHFKEHFEEASVGTVAEGADVKVTLLSDTSDPLAQEVILESVDVEGI